jgi:hypothetical protein
MEILLAQGAPLVLLRQWQMEKIFNQKSFNYFFYIIFSSSPPLRFQQSQSDSVPIIR